jgi:single-stranded DNA-binding protein
MNINDITFSGRVGKIGEMQGEKTEQKNGHYLDISIAAQDHYQKGKGRDKEGNPTDYPTTWMNARLLGSAADRFLDRVKKGKVVVVKGRLDVSTSGDGDDKKYWYRIVVNDWDGPFDYAKNESNGDEGGGEQEQEQKPAAKTASASKSSSNGGSKSNGSAKTSGTARKQAADDSDIPF